MILVDEIRNDCDYDDFYVVSREDAKIQYDSANKFIKRIEEYIAKILKEEELKTETPSDPSI